MRAGGGCAVEHCDELAGTGWKLRYDDAVFPPGTDSFLLAAFPRLRPGLRVCDLGCGTGVLGLLTLRRELGLEVTGLEVDGHAVELARRNIRENDLADRFCVLPCDLRDPDALPRPGAFDLALCNPPYFVPGRGRASPDSVRQATRCESACSFQDVARAASRLLRWGGALCLVHRPERLVDLCCALREAGLEPKRLQLVQSTPQKPPSLLLLEARRGGNPGLTVETPLVLYTSEGAPTAELDAIYHRNTEEML